MRCEPALDNLSGWLEGVKSAKRIAANKGTLRSGEGDRESFPTNFSVLYRILYPRQNADRGTDAGDCRLPFLQEDLRS